MAWGLDFDGNRGDPIRAIASGSVVSIYEYAKTGGDGHGGQTLVNRDTYEVIIRMSPGFECAYGFLSRPLVTTGARVQLGDLIGESGNINKEYASFRLWCIRDGKEIDPRTFLPKRS